MLPGNETPPTHLAHDMKYLAKLNIFSSQSMRHFFALELAHFLEGTRIHSLGRAIVMSRDWEKEWCMRVLEASDLQR